MSGFYTSSPWSGAHSAGQQIGNSLTKLASTMAQRRMMQQFQQQRMALMQQQINMRQGVDQSTIGANNARAGFDASRTSHQEAVDKSAGDAGQAMYANEMRKGLDNPQDAEKIIGMANLLKAVMQSAALSGNPQRAFPVHNVGPNSIAMNPMTGEQVAQGPIDLPTGGMYQAPGQQPVFNSKLSFAPAGSTPFVNAGGQVSQSGPQTGFAPRQMPRPPVPTFHPATEHSTPGVFDPRTMTYTPIMTDANWVSHIGAPLQFSNALSQAFDSSPTNAPTGFQPSQQGQRVRVQGPNGETGTVDSSEQLPPGWKPL